MSRLIDRYRILSSIDANINDIGHPATARRTPGLKVAREIVENAADAGELEVMERAQKALIEALVELEASGRDLHEMLHDWSVHGIFLELGAMRERGRPTEWGQAEYRVKGHDDYLAGRSRRFGDVYDERETGEFDFMHWLIMGQAYADGYRSQS